MPNVKSALDILGATAFKLSNCCSKFLSSAFGAGDFSTNLATFLFSANCSTFCFVSTGNIPSLASGYADNTAVYANQGVALDISSFIDSPKFGFGKKGNSNATYFENDSADNYVEDTTTAKADFSSSFLEIEKGMYTGGKLYSMPYSKSSEALYLNKDMMDKE